MPGPRDGLRDWLPLAVWPHPLTEGPSEGLFWERGNIGRDVLISATGWRVKRKGDRDNIEFLDPARSEFRCTPREPVSPLYCLSSSELWLSLMIESDPIDITFHQAGQQTIKPSISTLSVTYLRVRFLLRAHMEDKRKWSSCQTPRKAFSSSQYALARKWQLSRKKNQRTLTGDLEKSQNCCLPNREGKQWIQRFGNISR